jgi:hypothetical protein
MTETLDLLQLLVRQVVAHLGVGAYGYNEKKEAVFYKSHLKHEGPDWTLVDSAGPCAQRIARTLVMLKSRLSLGGSVCEQADKCCALLQNYYWGVARTICIRQRHMLEALIQSQLTQAAYRLELCDAEENKRGWWHYKSRGQHAFRTALGLDDLLYALYCWDNTSQSATSLCEATYLRWIDDPALFCQNVLVEQTLAWLLTQCQCNPLASSMIRLLRNSQMSTQRAEARQLLLTRNPVILPVVGTSKPIRMGQLLIQTSADVCVFFTEQLETMKSTAFTIFYYSLPPSFSPCCEKATTHYRWTVLYADAARQWRNDLTKYNLIMKNSEAKAVVIPHTPPPRRLNILDYIYGLSEEEEEEEEEEEVIMPF